MYNNNKQEIKRYALSDIIVPKFQSTFNDNTPNQINKGGRGRGATSTKAARIAYQAISQKGKSFVILRKHSNKIRRSVFKEVKKALLRLGLLENKDYKSIMQPFEIEILENGNKIYFTGIDNIDDIKGMVDEKNPIKEVWIEEITEFFNKSIDEGEDLINHIIATFARGNDEGFTMHYTFNPPTNPNHPANIWLKKMEKRKDFLIEEGTYLDVPKEWLGQAFIDQAQALKEADELLYRNVYLGESVGTKGLIYKIKDEYIIDERKSYYDYYTMAVDIGESKSATTFCLVGFYHLNGKLKAHQLEEYYHLNDKAAQLEEKEFDDYAEDFMKFYSKCINRYGRKPIEIRIDHDVMFAKALKRQFQHNRIDFSIVKKAMKRPIVDRIKGFKLLLAYDQLKFHKDCKITIQAFRDALWNTKKSDKGVDERLDDLTTNIDSIDCLEYAIEPQFGKMLIKEEYASIKKRRDE